MGFTVRYLAILSLLLTLTACSEPVPQDFADYVGEWTSPDMYLLIQANGSVKYKRRKPGGQVSLTGSIKGFKGHDFTVGFWMFSTTFEVSVPPHEQDGEWLMVVDDEELVRSRRMPQSTPQKGDTRSLQVRLGASALTCT